MLAGHFVDWVLDGLTDHLGKPERDLVVRTTLDRQLQQAAEVALERDPRPQGRAQRGSTQAAVVVLDTNGAVRAMVGGRDHRQSAFNRAVAARRQPGSAFKPFVYLAALEAGWRPGNTIDDRPVRIGSWQPAQLRRQVLGPITARRGVRRTRSTPPPCAWRRRVGPEAGRGRRRASWASSRPLQPVPSIALGTSEVSLLELTGAYLPFATGGIRRPLFGVTEVEDDRRQQLLPPRADRGARDRSAAADARCRS